MIAEPREFLRIAYLSNSVIPSTSANSVHVMKMCSAFSKLGHSVTLVHPADSGAEIRLNPDEIFAWYGVGTPFERVRLKCPAIKGRTAIHGFRAARVAIKRRADIAYCRDLSSCWFALRNGLRAVIELHMPPTKASRSELLLGRILRHSGLLAIVVITQALVSDLQKTWNIDHHKFLILPDAADDCKLAGTADLQAGNQQQVGYVGSLLPGKGMEIIADLPARCPWAMFHVVGGSTEQVQHWQKHLAGLPNIRMIGHVPPAEAATYVNAFDVLLAPNQPQVLVAGGTDIGRFTSPLKIFEYMSAEKPILASDLPVLREVLRQDENARLVDPTDPDQWALELAMLRDHPDLAKRLGEAARKEWCDRFSWDARARTIVDELSNR